MRSWLAGILALACLPAAAADILGAAYDPLTDQILVNIAYRGTEPGHDFRVQWGRCQDGGVAGRLVDEQAMEPAREPFQVIARVSLAGLPCPRPTLVTLRLGRFSHASLRIPE